MPLPWLIGAAAATAVGYAVKKLTEDSGSSHTTSTNNEAEVRRESEKERKQAAAKQARENLQQTFSAEGERRKADFEATLTPFFHIRWGKSAFTAQLCNQENTNMVMDLGFLLAGQLATSPQSDTIKKSALAASNPTTELFKSIENMDAVCDGLDYLHASYDVELIPEPSLMADLEEISILNEMHQNLGKQLSVLARLKKDVS